MVNQNEAAETAQTPPEATPEASPVWRRNRLKELSMFPAGLIGILTGMSHTHSSSDLRTAKGSGFLWPVHEEKVARK